ncbi:MAG: triacylglycerol lipase [Pseudomonadales bacterium]|nr:triacylglycerol lipase [Pseudomonadales bacterium]
MTFKNFLKNTFNKKVVSLFSAVALIFSLSSNSLAGSHDDYVSVKNCSWWDLICKVKQEQNRYNTKYPIVLVHGLSGFDKVLFVEYFHQVPSTLRDGNANVYVPNLSAWDGVEVRGEQLLKYIESHVLPHSGASKVNLIGHSMGSLTSRYVAGVKPGIVASVTSVHGVNYGSHFADFMLHSLLPQDNPLYGTYIDFMDGLLGTLGAVIDFLSSGESFSQDAFQASYDLSTQGNAELNAKYPAGGVTSTCGSGPETASNGVSYYSWGGIGGVTNVADPLDYAMTFIGMATANEQTDGLVGRCSQHWGKVLRDDYNLNHTDASNLLFGMTGFTDPKDIYESHASRLRGKGL